MTEMSAKSRTYTGPALLIVAALLSGCANQASIQVGSIPDDYRTNHPIIIGEKEKTLDLPVGASASRMTELHRVALKGFLTDYDHAAAPYVAVLVPVGSANEAAAYRASGDIVAFMRREGIPRERIVVQSYFAPSPESPAPIRVSYAVLKASAGPCGRWPEDIADTTENRHYANFGCSYQNNLAAQIANPADLLGPRKMTTIDSENRDNAIGEYKSRVISDEFISQSEVSY
jgi:pilus assembly protein CpaD